MTEQPQPQAMPNGVMLATGVIPPGRPGAVAGVFLRMAWGPLLQVQAITDPDTALEFANMVKNAAREAKRAKSGLVVPEGLIVPQNGDGPG